MSQQQLTESQLPITHEVLIETETNFRNALTANKSTTQTKQIQIIKIIPPFSREIVRSAENLAQAYRSCASDILKQFPTTMQQKMTISKTITVTKDDRKLHTLTVIAPLEAEQFITSIKSEGIILLNRTVFPMGCFPRSVPFCRMTQHNLPATEKRVTKGLMNKKVLRWRVRMF